MAHREVLTHEKDDKVGVFGRQPKAHAEGLRFFCAEFGMISPAALGDVVKKPRNRKPPGLGEFAYCLGAERKFMRVGGVGKAP